MIEVLFFVMEEEEETTLMWKKIKEKFSLEEEPVFLNPLGKNIILLKRGLGLEGKFSFFLAEDLLVLIREGEDNLLDGTTISSNFLGKTVVEFMEGENDLELLESDEDYRFYRFLPRYNRESFLLKFFILEGELHKFTPKAKLYLEQAEILDTKRAGILKQLPDILGEIEKFGSDLEILEKNLGRISDLYNDLALEYTVIKGYLAEVQRDMDKILRLTKKIFSFEAESVYINDSLGEVALKANRLKEIAERFENLLSHLKSGVEVINSRIQLIQSRETKKLQEQMYKSIAQNIELTREGVALQVAAAFIEFIVVTYYTLSIWKYLTPEEVFRNLNPGLKLGLVVTFAGLSVYVTHLVAIYYNEKKKKDKIKVFLVFAFMLIIVGIMFWLGATGK